MESNRTADLYNIVIFGGNGDLAMRKLLPALYSLFKHDHLNPEGLIIGASRTSLSSEDYTQLVHDALGVHLGADEFEQSVWDRFSKKLRYAEVDANNPDSFHGISDICKHSSAHDNVYYFSTSPSLFGSICENLHRASLITEYSRVVLEKPIGENLASSKKINDQVAAFFDEGQIYRIDHYLGKETVQNLLSVRFANTLFEPLWNCSAIDHVQITVAETVGVGSRWSYYDKAGALRDMVQNHLLQLLCLVAMEPPSDLDADSVRDEKLKVLRSLREITPDQVGLNTVRGQYLEGAVGGQPVEGYLSEGNGSASKTETFVALRAEIDNWRWAGVPFYLRTGKRLPTRCAEIVIQFNAIPHSIFRSSQDQVCPNKLVIRLQPEESIQLVMMNKVPGLEESMRMQAVPLNLSLDKAFDNPNRTPTAYERLLLDVLRANQTLFMRRDEVEGAWQWIDKILEGWKMSSEKPKPYTAGSWGPAASVALIVRDGRNWHD
ncbi:MAG: glucose-6-phosphate dehydrogenase [Pseudobacteriovorax sp.]|nr:glucose-6-phosphate dehydrogenase [Pseudobacteriovorax sp.]